MKMKQITVERACPAHEAVERVCRAHDVEPGEPWYEVKVDGAVALRLWGAELLALLHAISELSHLSAYRFTQIGDSPPAGDRP